MKNQEIQVLGLQHLHANTTLEFNGNGVCVQVSLNVSNKIAAHLSPNNIFKGVEMKLYKLRKQVPSQFITAATIQMVQQDLLNNCMINIRNAKVASLQKEIACLQSK